MKKRITLLLTCLYLLSTALFAQTSADSIPELAHLFRILGGEDALNIDGGGSTTLWMGKASDKGVLNCPSDNGKFDHKGERRIPNIIYVRKR